jgi:pyrroline-5-carboxylate reductase
MCSGKLKGTVRPQTLFVSIAAGITTSLIESFVAPAPVVRTMPNTPLMVGMGAVAIAAGAQATVGHLQQTRALFEPLGIVVEVSEPQLDAVTALSGSGPAYFFFLVEQMIKAGVQMGLSPEVARRLAIQTAAGAGKMLASSDLSPTLLRQNVTSPNGTTQAAIEHMQKHSLDSIIIDALRAAEQRSIALGKK